MQQDFMKCAVLWSALFHWSHGGNILFPIPSLSKLRGVLCAFVVLSQGLAQIINKGSKES